MRAGGGCSRAGWRRLSAAAGDDGDAVAEGQGAGGAAAACSGCGESSSGGVERAVCAGKSEFKK